MSISCLSYIYGVMNHCDVFNRRLIRTVTMNETMQIRNGQSNLQFKNRKPMQQHNYTTEQLSTTIPYQAQSYK